MLTEILKLDRTLRICYKKTSQENDYCDDLFPLINQLLSSYSEFYSLSSDEVISRNHKFSSEYLEDVKRFSSTFKYPCKLRKLKKITHNQKISYDLALIISVTLTTHRNKIMSSLLKYLDKISGRILVIGAGPGIELKLLKAYGKDLDVVVYDINISNFIYNEFGSFTIVNEEFIGHPDELYDHIIAIELLEHVSRPYSLLQIFFNSLKKSGKLFTTTASNLPQFDHLYNFANDDFMDNVNFNCIYHEEIPHMYQSFNIGARNNLYVLEKV